MALIFGALAAFLILAVVAFMAYNRGFDDGYAIGFMDGIEEDPPEDGRPL